MRFINGSTVTLTISAVLQLSGKPKLPRTSLTKFTSLTITHSKRSSINNSASSANASWLIVWSSVNAIFADSLMPRATNAMVVENYLTLMNWSTQDVKFATLPQKSDSQNTSLLIFLRFNPFMRNGLKKLQKRANGLKIQSPLPMLCWKRVLKVVALPVTWNGVLLFH